MADPHQRWIKVPGPGEMRWVKFDPSAYRRAGEADEVWQWLVDHDARIVHVGEAPPEDDAPAAQGRGSA